MSIGGDTTVPTHPLVQIAQRLGTPMPSFVELKGYLGPSPTSGNVRLYLDIAFKAYIEFPASGYVASDPVDPSVPYQPTRVYVLSDVSLTRHERSGISTAAEFAAGPVAEELVESDVEVQSIGQVIVHSVPPRACLASPA